MKQLFKLKPRARSNKVKSSMLDANSQYWEQIPITKDYESLIAKILKSHAFFSS